MTRSLSSLQKASPTIKQTLDTNDKGVWRHAELKALFEEHRKKWRLPVSMGFNAFLSHLVAEMGLVHQPVPLPHRQETLYLWGKVPTLAVAAAAKPTGYLSHFTALALHELTVQDPKTIYLNVEQRAQPSDPGSLTQEGIDRAFRNAQRMTTNVAEIRGHRLVCLNGKQTGQLGVINLKLATGETVRVTDLERTMIDIAVRPAYAGGVAHVADAYRNAKDRLSVPKLASMLEDMQFVYPYEQAIGYYLERAGVDSTQLEPFRRKPFRFSFYLAHRMHDRAHVDRWKLFVPKGM